MKRIAVFASGNGTNLVAINQAILDKELECTIELLVVDQLNAPVIEKARLLNIETYVCSPKDYPSKTAYETDILKQLKSKKVEYIVLAGYMRLITKVLLDAYPKRIINIHPSLLPKYKGLDAIGQAYRDNADEMGVTIHYIDDGMDTGEIIDQRSFKVNHDESLEQIEKRIHDIEHVFYWQTLKKLWEEE